MSKSDSKAGKLRSKLKNVFVDAIQESCGLMHLGLVTGVRGVENVESFAMKRLTGQSAKNTVSDRRAITIRRRHKIAQTYDQVKNKLNDFADARFGNKEDAMVETLVHGDAQ